MWRWAPLVSFPACPGTDNIVWGSGGGESVDAVEATPVAGGALKEPKLTHTWWRVGLGRAVPWGVAGECEELLDECGGEPSAYGAAGSIGEVPPCDEFTVCEELQHAAALTTGQKHCQWTFQDGLVGAFL